MALILRCISNVLRCQVRIISHASHWCCILRKDSIWVIIGGVDVCWQSSHILRVHALADLQYLIYLLIG